MQAFCWSRHCLQAFDCSARAAWIVLQKPSSTSMTTATARMTVSFDVATAALDNPVAGLELIPLIPAQAGIQVCHLGPRFRGDERTGIDSITSKLA
jgi:hypothetical protein